MNRVQPLENLPTENLQTEAPLQTQYTSASVSQPDQSYSSPLRRKALTKVENLIKNINSNMALITFFLIEVFLLVNLIISDTTAVILLLLIEIGLMYIKAKRFTKGAYGFCIKFGILCSEVNFIDSMCRVSSEILYLIFRFLVKKSYAVSSIPIFVSVVWIVLVYIFKEPEDPDEAEV